MEKEIDIAKIKNCDIGFDDHGLFLMFGRFIYQKEGVATGSQGIGYVIDEEFIKRFIRVCDGSTLLDCEGQLVKVEHTNDKITKIISLTKDGKIFDIEKWSADAKSRRGKIVGNITLYDIRDLLQSTADAIEKVILLETELNSSYDYLMNNAKAVDIAGLKRPDFVPYIRELNVQKQILLTLKFHVECRIKDSQKIRENKTKTQIEGSEERNRRRKRR